MIYLTDNWGSQNAYFTITGLEITDLLDVMLYSADLDGALVMESEDGYADYGMLGTGTIDYADQPLPTLQWWDESTSEWEKVAEPYHEGGLTSEYWRGDKSFATLNASAIINTPSGDIEATDVQAAIEELDTEKQSISGMDAASLASFKAAVASKIVCHNGDIIVHTGEVIYGT
jgi:hypothetical protein